MTESSTHLGEGALTAAFQDALNSYVHYLDSVVEETQDFAETVAGAAYHRHRLVETLAHLHAAGHSRTVATDLLVASLLAWNAQSPSPPIPSSVAHSERVQPYRAL